MPSIIACSFNNSATISRESIKRYIKVAYPFLQAEFFLPWPSSELEQVIDQILNCLNSADLITHHDVADSFTRPPIGTEQQAQLMILAKVVSPVLELYYMIFALIAEHGSDSITRKRLEELCYLMAQRLSLMYEINSPDFFDKRLITNFINSLIKLGYVSINDSDKLELSEYALKEGRFARRLLDKNMQYNILQMLRTATSHK